MGLNTIPNSITCWGILIVLNLNLIPKWATLIFTTLALCMLLLSTTSFAESYRWGTNWGNMVVSTNDGQVFTGTYDGAPNGRLWGKYNESSRKFVGLWYQSKSDKKCGSPRKGTWYWGTLFYQLNPNETSFRGAWGYCRAKPSHEWTGQLQ